MTVDSKIYSFEEVAKHSKTKDCWIVVHGKVYDVTPFMDDHPGGDEVLLSATAKDATDDFEDTGHSDTARDLMAQYCIGKIDATTTPPKRVYTTPKPTTSNKSPDFLVKILQFLVPLMILGLAFAVRHYTKEK